MFATLSAHQVSFNSRLEPSQVTNYSQVHAPLQVQGRTTIRAAQQALKLHTAQYNERAAYVKNCHLVSVLNDAEASEQVTRPSELADLGQSQRDLVAGLQLAQAWGEQARTACAGVGLAEFGDLLAKAPRANGIQQLLVQQVDALLLERVRFQQQQQ